MTIRVGAAALCALFLASCRLGAPRLGPPPPAAARAPESPDGTQWISADAARAEKVGASPPRVVSFGAGAAGDSLGGRIEVPAGLCTLLLARGGPSIEDLDVFVYGEDGAELGADETPSSTASVIVCPPHPVHLYAFGRVAAGHGIFSISEQFVRPSDADRAAEAVGAAGKLREDAARAGTWPGLEEALARHRREIGGVWRDLRRSAIPMDPRIPTRASVTIETHQCVDVFAMPSDDVAYVELSILDSEGRIVGRGSTDQRAPSAIVCAPTHTDVTFELRPHAGRGLSALVLSVTDAPEELAPNAGKVFAYGSPEPISLEQRQASAAERLAKSGYQPPSMLEKGTVSVGKRQSLDLDVPEGCSRIDVLTGDPARGVDAWLWSPSGAFVARGDGDSSATLFACGAMHRARLDVEALGRSGPFSVELRNVRGLPPVLSEHPVASGRLLGRLTASDRIVAPKDVGAPSKLTVSAETLAVEHVDVAERQCADVAVGLDVGAEGVDLRLVDAQRGTELALSHGTYSALAEACALEHAGALKVKIEVRVEAGMTEALVASKSRAVAH